VSYVNVPPEAAFQAMVAAGVPEWLAKDYVALLVKVYATGAAASVTPVVADLTGKPPRTFDRLARDFAGVFAGRQSQPVG